MTNDVNGISMDYTTESSGVVVEGTTFVSLDMKARISELESLVREMGRWMDKIGWPCQDMILPEEQEFYDQGTEILNRPEVKAIMEVEVMGKEPCSNCGRTSCNGIDCYYEDEVVDNDPYFCPICKRDCCVHFIDTLNQLSALKTLIRMMAETLLFYSERGGGRARDLYRHPLTQQVLDESGYYEVKV